MTSTVYFVRHGECQGNVEEMHPPPDLDILTERGKLQVVYVGKHLQNVTFTKAYTSPFPRALETARGILAESNRQVPELQQDSRLQERDLGIFENGSSQSLWIYVMSDVKRNGTTLLDFEIPGGETVKELDERVDSFWEFLFEEIRQSDTPQTILVVSHTILMVRMFLKLKRLAEDAERDLTLNGWSKSVIAVQTKNTGYHIFNIEAPKNTKRTVVDIVKTHQIPHLSAVNEDSLVGKPSKEFLGIMQNFKELVAEQCATQ